MITTIVWEGHIPELTPGKFRLDIKSVTRKEGGEMIVINIDPNSIQRRETHLVVDGIAFRLKDDDLPELYKRKLIYDCGTIHGDNVHLDPGHEYCLEDVELLIKAIEEITA